MRSLLKRLLRAETCPNYIYAFKKQGEQEKAYIKSLPPIQEPFMEPGVSVSVSVEPTDTYVKYKNLIRSKKFLRNANFRWLESYEIFLEDMGESPNLQSKIVLIEGMTSYNKVTCKWD